MVSELKFPLREKKDRNGKKYLFGSIRLNNQVIFIRKLDEEGKWEGVIKPYIPKKEGESNGDDDFDRAWND